MAVKCILTGQTPSVLDGVTENVQTQIDAKAANNAVVHLTENETISGAKTFTGKVVMKGNDNVGIGTTTPSEKLEVTGNVKATKFKGDGSALTNIPYPVTKVAGKTGAVTLVKGDVGLGNVDNTSDKNKPISNATQMALNDKQSRITANGFLKGDGTGNITAADETEVELVDLPQEIFWATYKETTYAEVKTAYDAQKVIFVNDNTNNIYVLEGFEDGKFTFCAVKGLIDFGGIQTTTCSCSSSSGWSSRYVDGSYIDFVTISLSAASWSDSVPYTQTIAILEGKRGVQANIQLSDTLYDQLVADGVTYLNIENNKGTFTAKAKGGKPSVDLTVQVSLIKGTRVVLLDN